MGTREGLQTLAFVVRQPHRTRQRHRHGSSPDGEGKRHGRRVSMPSHVSRCPAKILTRDLRNGHLAGQQAIQRSAYAEAISHLSTAVELLETLPDAVERAQRELALQLTLGRAMGATKGQGAPEMGQAYTRARELCQ